MTVEYRLEDVTSIKAEIKAMFWSAYPERADEVDIMIDNERMKHHISAREDGVLIGSMGILKVLSPENWTDPIVTQDDIDNGYYSFHHLAVLEQSRMVGVATGILISSLKLLHHAGASKIRNHKRENIIPHKFFTDNYFTEITFNDENPEYKWTYLLDINAVAKDSVKWSFLENQWRNYVIIT